MQTYQQYGAQSNTYSGGDGYGSPGPYGRSYDEPQQQLNPPAPLQRHGESNYSQPSQYPQGSASGPSNRDAPGQGDTMEAPRFQPLSRDDFFARIEGAKRRIGQLTSDIQAIAKLHQRMLSSPDNQTSTELKAIVTNTQIRNTQIKDEIKFLERDAVRDPNDRMKKSQVEALMRTFKSQLKDFQKEEADHSKRYREAIGRQYRIINPDATDAEVEEVANADLGNEGIFTQALKSNRSGQAANVLRAVRARHNDIQRIEKTMSELAMLFTQLNEQVMYQGPGFEQVEEQAVKVKDDTNNANQQLGNAIKSAKRARRCKCYTILTIIAILCVIVLSLVLYFELKAK